MLCSAQQDNPGTRAFPRPHDRTRGHMDLFLSGSFFVYTSISGVRRLHLRESVMRHQFVEEGGFS